MPLVILEGIDGCGKTTQIDLLKQHYPEALFLREPGGTSVGEALREILLNPENNHNLASKTELLIFLAARAQLFAERIKPALRDKKLVIMDRFVYSTIAYQIVGLQMSDKHVWIDLIKLIIEGIEPDYLFWLDLPFEKTLERRVKKKNDKIEERGPQYLEKVYDAYQELMNLTGIRIDATQSPEEINKVIRSHIK